ncbi:MAG TPA: hypothetical protein VH107_11135 [Lacipirellulaceae bacterium]|jgi:hypothetical protein|nr:hypothetical protein [Lacipirellulaceae bacterium]
MNAYQLDEDSYLDWNKSRPNAFVLNRFGGNDPAFNVLHHSDCPFLWREVDEGARTVVEKWCSESEEELREHANSAIGLAMWKRCGYCFRARKNSASTFSSVETFNPIEVRSNDQLWICGEPAVFAGSGVGAWKQLVKEAFKEILPADFPQWIDVEFRFLEERLYAKDIDNLLTPILESARDGGWIKRGFAWLGSITARKTAVAEQSQVGVSIKLHTLPPSFYQETAGVLVEAQPARLDEKTVKWAIYEAAFHLYEHQPNLRFPPQTSLSVEIRVSIDDAANRKSIAALLKPCIDGLEPILGHPFNLLPESREIIKRRLAPQDEMILSLGFHLRGGTATKISAYIAPL